MVINLQGTESTRENQWVPHTTFCCIIYHCFTLKLYSQCIDLRWVLVPRELMALIHHDSSVLRAMSKHRPCVSLILRGKAITKISRDFTSLHLPPSHSHPYWSTGFPKASLNTTKTDFCITELTETLTVWSVYRIDSKLH